MNLRSTWGQPEVNLHRPTIRSGYTATNTAVLERRQFRTTTRFERSISYYWFESRRGQ